MSRILTNCGALLRAGGLAEADRISVRGFSSLKNDLRSATSGEVDVVLVEGDPSMLLRWCLARLLLPRPRFSIVSLDLLPKRPTSVRERLRLPPTRLLLRQAALFLVYQKDVTGFCEVLGIEPGRVHHVPFKVNRIEALRQMVPTDNGVFLSCGRSYRDYATLCEAFRDLPYECEILAQWSEVERHGTRFDGIDVPGNVKLISDDGTPDSWNSIISRSRAVILPIDPDALFPAGIGTYLVAMAMGKCVIMTTGPGTTGMLDDETAVLVPPKDPVALREAIQRVAEDREYREHVAAAGKRYALALGGEERLVADVLREIEGSAALAIRDGSEVASLGAERS